MRKAIIDADAIVYIVAHHHRVVPKEEIAFYDDLSAEDKTLQIKECYKTKSVGDALGQVDSLIRSILHAVNATEYIGFLADRNGSDTFRHERAVTVPYKYSRSHNADGSPKGKPHNIEFWKPIMVNHMVNKWGFHELSNIEADDACCIYQTEYENTVICSPDKDLRQCAGMFYDFGADQSNKYSCTADRISHVDKFSGMYSLYFQCLVGDTTDSIPGCKGVGKGETDLKDANNNIVYKDPALRKGKIKVVSKDKNGNPKAGAPKVLFNLKTQAEMQAATFAMYQAKHGADAARMMNEQMMLVYMLRKFDQVPGGLEKFPFREWIKPTQAHEAVKQEAAKVEIKSLFTQNPVAIVQAPSVELFPCQELSCKHLATCQYKEDPQFCTIHKELVAARG